jgi:hypothetical protein
MPDAPEPTTPRGGEHSRDGFTKSIGANTSPLPVEDPHGLPDGYAPIGAPVGPSTPGEPAETPTGEAPLDADAEPEDHPNARSEAARYRRRLRDTEATLGTMTAERDALAVRLDAHDRAAVERLATTLASTLADPSDLWRDGATLADVLDADGNADPRKVAVVVASVIEAHPTWAKPVGQPWFDNGAGPRGNPVPGATLDAEVRRAVRGGR